MSSTNRGAIRVAQDLYETPFYLIDRLLEAVPLPGGRWLEPCAASGNIIKAVNAKRSDVIWSGCEIRSEAEEALRPLCQETCYIGDFLGAPVESWGPKFDVILTNPPFSLAQEFIEQSMHMAHETIMLLRLNYLESGVRCSFMQEFPPDVFVLPNRPVFGFNKHGKLGTDSTAYGFMRWRSYEWYELNAPKMGHLQILGETPLAERKAWNAHLRQLAAAA